MENKYKIAILIVIIIILIVGGYYGFKAFWNNLFNVSDPDDVVGGLRRAADDSGRVEGDIEGMGDIISDAEERVGTARERVETSTYSIEEIERRSEDIERSLVGIGEGANTVRRGIEIGEGAKERLEQLLQRISKKYPE
jgi:hypothetical protein